MSEELTDLIVEAIEVFLNHILYLRDLYPQRIFIKRRFYNAPVYVSKFPALNSYIKCALSAARELQQRNNLQAVFLHFYQDELGISEYYTFEIKRLQPAIEVKDQLDMEPALLYDKFFIDFEEELRASLYKLAERLKMLNKLPKGAQFRIILNTTQEAFVRFSHISHYQDFPWLCNVFKEKAERNVTLLPLTCLDTLGLKLNLEQFN
ncbi:DNA polymerase zeta subunit 2 [Eurosta solidaginis]|uniref:DNA polymerase zeta subunit 2 n=1 Tax=Eurosta solidaginis TaxID=178769 RepID=UPI0035310A9E